MPFNKVDYEATKNIPIPLGEGQLDALFIAASQIY